MPLTEEQRQKLQARLAEDEAISSSAPGALPESIASMVSGLPQAQPTMSMSAGGIRMTNPPSNQQVQRDLVIQMAKEKLKQLNPTMTADQRDRVVIAQEALRKVNAVRGTLGIKGEQLTDRKPLTIFKQTPNSVQNPFLAPDAKQLRTQFNSAADLLAMLRTGKQGEKTQVDRVIAEYNPGNFDKSHTVIDRLNEMENEIRAFGSGQLKSPLPELMEDANGNRAYVYPDGRVEEVD